MLQHRPLTLLASNRSPRMGAVWLLSSGLQACLHPPAGIGRGALGPSPRCSRRARRLRAAGVPVLRAPRREPWGLVEMWVADPDGLPLALVEIPEDHPLRRDHRDRR